jgi:SH3 domain protein
VRYVSDKQFIPLRSGAGSDYRIIHRGIPSGTRLTIARTSGDGEWAEITTEKGTTGWIRTQYLMQDLPAQNRVDAAEKRAAEAVAKSAALSEELAALRAQSTELEGQLNSSGSELGSVTEELAQLKQISGNAIQLDIDNRRLVEESENQRLQDKLESEDFLNGALAVLLGVIITLVVPRLWPKRRKSSSWA